MDKHGWEAGATLFTLFGKNSGVAFWSLMSSEDKFTVLRARQALVKDMMPVFRLSCTSQNFPLPP